jgi:hypothetical protein
MQDDQIGQKITGLAPPDKARLPHLINTKNVFSTKRPIPSAWTTPTLNLPCFMYKRNCPFLTRQSPSSSKISMAGPDSLGASNFQRLSKQTLSNN